MVDFTIKCPVTICTQTANVSRKLILSDLLESDIGKVRDMSEIAYGNEVN